MTLVVTEAAGPADYAAFGDVIADYFDWLRARYADAPAIVDRVATVQDLAAERAALATAYAPPRGRAFLARVDGAVVGAGAWRRRDAAHAEMKRLFVRAAAQGHGAGRALATAIMASARAEGFATMWLDTTDRMTEAHALYRALGFVPVAPFNDYPPDVMAGMSFLAAPLRGRGVPI